MIIDGHMYIFPPKDAQAGYPTLEEKMRIVQSEEGAHHQPPWRVRDRVPADNSTLIDPDTGELRDVIWTRDELGRLAWIFEGEMYTKVHTPPMLHNLESTPELMIAEMDYAGIEVGLIHTYPVLGQYEYLNRHLHDATSRFPDRLRRLISIKEADVPDNPAAMADYVKGEVEAGGAAGLQFIPGFYYQGGHTDTWDGGKLQPFWDSVAELNLPVYFTILGGVGTKAYSSDWNEGYLAEQDALARWMKRYPHLSAVITHGFPWRAYYDGESIKLPDAIFDVFDSPNCYLQFLIPIMMGNIWEYPWTEAEPAIRQCVERIGSERLIYGTDMPMVARFCTYKQSIDEFRTHCDFLTDADRENVLGRTAARLMNIPWKVETSA